MRPSVSDQVKELEKFAQKIERLKVEAANAGFLRLWILLSVPANFVKWSIDDKQKFLARRQANLKRRKRK